MNLELYQELTGIQVDPEDEVSITAQIRRTKNMLQTLLGYTLDKKKAGLNQYEELGKSTVECPFRGLLSEINVDELAEPDDVEGSYRLFSYNSADQYFAVDPFTQVYKVKLVYLRAGDEPNGITHKTLTDSKIRIHKTGMISKYIERCPECWCACECDECVQLAVDADWLNEDCLPEDLLYLWVDMIEYYADPKRDLVEETLATHRWKKDKRVAPESLDASIAILRKYAGPNGSLARTIVV